MYMIQLPQDLMSELWKLREYHHKGPIIRQVREAVAMYVAHLKGKDTQPPRPLGFEQTEAGHLLETRYRSIIEALLKTEGIEPPDVVTIRLKGA